MIKIVISCPRCSRVRAYWIEAAPGDLLVVDGELQEIVGPQESPLYVVAERARKEAEQEPLILGPGELYDCIEELERLFLGVDHRYFQEANP